MLAAVYCRISDDRESSGLGVARQEKACRELCDRNGWEVAEVLVDNDVSAYRGRKRPAYLRLLDGLKNGDYQAVVCWHPDRLHRSPKELELFIDIIELSGAAIATVSAGNWDLSTPTGRAVARTVGAWARFESEHKAERQRAKHDEMFLAGRPAGGDRCFGFDDDNITHLANQADALRWAVQHLLDGGSLRSVCSTWNDAGILTTFGNLWQPWVVKRLVTSAKIAGKRERNGVTVDAVWDPIVPWETVQRLRAILSDPSRRRNHHSRRYLLTGGVAVCGLCDKPLIARPKADGRRCYVCASGPGFYGCGKIRVLADEFEADVVERLLARLRLEELPEPADDSAPLVALLDTLEAQQAELATDFYSHRTISRGQFTAASASLMDKIGSVKRSIAKAELVSQTKRIGDPKAIADSFGSLTIDDQRAVCQSWLERVVVGSAVRGRNYYDDARVSVEWAD